VRVAASVLGATAAAVACVSLVLPWLAARDVEQALATWRADPAGAYALLDSARQLNGLSDEPDLFAGAIASRRGELARMRTSFERALERNPVNWYAELELALLDTRDGAWATATQRLRRALELNPGEPVLEDVLERVKRRERVPFAEVDRLFVLRSQSRLA
jgi:tetratricopeptide (TPR) repeat protein